MAYNRRFTPRRPVRLPKPAPKPPVDLADRKSYPEADLERVQALYGGVWLAYTNLWTKERSVYKPATAGTHVIAFKPGLNGKIEGTNSTIELGMGCASAPQRDFSGILAEFALFCARFPEIAERVAVYRVPCVYSSREAWVMLPYVLPEELLADATETARQMKHGYGQDAYKRRHKLSTTYF